jgi:hypothetical protein
MKKRVIYFNLLHFDIPIFIDVYLICYIIVFFFF